MSLPEIPAVNTRTSTPLSRASAVPSAVGSPVRKSATIYDRSLLRKRGDVSLSAFAYLFSETVQYLQKQATGVSELEAKLNRLGYHVGQRVIELLTLREGRSAKRETKTLGVLQFVHTHVWRTLFGRPADALEKSTEHANQYMLIDNNPVVTEFVSVPRDISQLNCAAFAAGIIEAVLDASLFTARVSAHTMAVPDKPYRTVFLVEFDQERA